MKQTEPNHSAGQTKSFEEAGEEPKNKEKLGKRGEEAAGGGFCKMKRGWGFGEETAKEKLLGIGAAKRLLGIFTLSGLPFLMMDLPVKNSPLHNSLLGIPWERTNQFSCGTQG